MTALLLALLIVGAEPEKKVDPQESVLVEINAIRARHGLHGLIRDARLQRIAERRCRQMAKRGYCGHLSGVQCAEGIGCRVGHRSAKGVIACMIYSPRYHRCGAAMFYSRRTHRTYYCVCYE